MMPNATPREASTSPGTTDDGWRAWIARLGRWVRDYWHWPVLVGAAVYLYLQVLPPVDLAEPGTPAPPVEAETLAGETFRLSEHRGEVVVVNVWATWCPPCRVEMPGFVDLHREMDGRGVQFVGIAVDQAVDQAGAERVRQFANEHDIAFPTIHSPRLAAQAFPGDAVPRTYLIDQNGHVRYQHTGLILKPALRNAIEALRHSDE